MTSDSICSTRLQPETDAEERLFDSWFDPIESAVRDRVRSFIEELIEGELAAAAGEQRTAVVLRPRRASLTTATAAGRER